jgi:hypothetical protein
MGADDFNIEAFTELYQEWLHSDEDERRGSDLEERLREQYRQAWEVGGRYPHLDVLHFIMQTRLAEGADLAWEALKEDDELIVAAGLSAALMLLRDHPELAEAAVITQLKGLAENGPPRLRFLALQVLDRPRINGLEPWLRDLAGRTDDDAVRMGAFRALLRSGYEPAKQAFLDDMREHANHYARAIDLFGQRAALNLTAAEEREVREMLQRYVDKTRQMVLDGTPSPPVSVVGALARDGLAIDDAAAEAIAHYARTAESASDRRQAVEALAAIGTPRASELLGELAFAELADVAERAREVLE